MGRKGQSEQETRSGRGKEVVGLGGQDGGIPYSWCLPLGLLLNKNKGFCTEKVSGSNAQTQLTPGNPQRIC